MEGSVPIRANTSQGIADFERLINDAVSVYVNLADDDKIRAQLLCQRMYMQLCVLHDESSQTAQPAVEVSPEFLCCSSPSTDPALPVGRKEAESHQADKETWLIVSSSFSGASSQTKDTRDAASGNPSIITGEDGCFIGIHCGSHNSQPLQQFDQMALVSAESTSLKEASHGREMTYDGTQTALSVSNDFSIRGSSFAESAPHGVIVATRSSSKGMRRSCLICGMNFKLGHTFRKHLRKHGRGMLSCIACRRELSNYAVYLHHRCMWDSSKLQRQWPGEAPGASNSNGRSPDPSNGHVLCMTCETWFDGAQALSQHVASRHVVCNNEPQLQNSSTAAIRRYWCEKCKQPFQRRQHLSQHVELHAKYDCRQCTDSYFVSKHHIYRHNRLYHKSKGPSFPAVKRYECTSCNKRFMRPGILKIHQRIHTGERPLTCLSCHFGFRTPKALARHKLTLAHQQRSGDMPQTKDFVCEACGSAFYRKMALQRHLASHAGQPMLQCPHCDYQAKEKGTLKIHIRLHFPSEKNFVCESCGAAFHTKSTLQTHMQYKHKDDRDFSCSVCQIKLKTRSALNRHLLTHTDNKPHKCTACGSAFRRQYNLRRHAKQVHGSDSELPPVKKLKRIERSADEVLQELMQAEAQASQSEDGARVAAAAEFFQDGLVGIGNSHVASAADTYLTFISDPLTFSQQTFEGLSTVDAASQCPAFSVPHQSISASLETSTVMPSSSTLVHLTAPPPPLQQTAELYQLSGFVPIASASLPTATTGATAGSMHGFFMATASVHNPMSSLDTMPYVHQDDSNAG